MTNSTNKEKIREEIIRTLDEAGTEGNFEHYADVLLPLISSEIKKAYQRGWNKKVVAHQTNEGYCCACGADVAEMEDRIKKAKEEERKKIREDVMGLLVEENVTVWGGKKAYSLSYHKWLELLDKLK